MDLDLDLFERRRSRDRGRRHGRSWRRDHRHLFSWLFLGGGVLLLGIALLALASSFGLFGHLADAYFALSRAVLPSAWHDEWLALPDLAHVALVLGALFLAAGLAGEVFD